MPVTSSPPLQVVVEGVEDDDEEEEEEKEEVEGAIQEMEQSHHGKRKREGMKRSSRMW